MKALDSLRTAIDEIGRGTDPVSQRAFAAASAAIVDLEAHFGAQPRPHLLGGVDEDCITRCRDIGGGWYEMRARLGTVEVSEFHHGDEETQSDEAILAGVRAGIIDSLRVEIVRRDVANASDSDLLDALDAAERGGDDEVGEIRAAAHHRGLRRIG